MGLSSARYPSGLLVFGVVGFSSLELRCSKPDTVECVERYFKNACGHAVAAAVHRLAEFSEESCEQPNSLNALSSFMKRSVRPFTP